MLTKDAFEWIEDEKVDIRDAWLEKLGAPDFTYDWDEHPEGYDNPCACALCRYYATYLLRPRKETDE